jgi:hypothetical protein
LFPLFGANPGHRRATYQSAVSLLTAPLFGGFEHSFVEGPDSGPKMSHPPVIVEAMAAVFEFDQAQGARAAQMVDVGLTAIQTAVSQLRPKAAIGEIGRARRFLAGLETEVLATAVTADGDTRHADRLANDGKTSKRERRRRSQRAKANAASGGSSPRSSPRVNCPKNKPT